MITSARQSRDSQNLVSTPRELPRDAPRPFSGQIACLNPPIAKAHSRRCRWVATSAADPAEVASLHCGPPPGIINEPSTHVRLARSAIRASLTASALLSSLNPHRVRAHRPSEPARAARSRSIARVRYSRRFTASSVTPSCAAVSSPLAPSRSRSTITSRALVASHPPRSGQRASHRSARVDRWPRRTGAVRPRWGTTTAHTTFARPPFACCSSAKPLWLDCHGDTQGALYVSGVLAR